MNLKKLLKALSEKERKSIFDLLLLEMSKPAARYRNYFDEPDGLTVGEWLEKVPYDLPGRLYNFLKKAPHLPIAEIDDRYSGFGYLMGQQLAYHRELAREAGYFRSGNKDDAVVKRHWRETPAPQIIKLTDAETKAEIYVDIFAIKGFEVSDEVKATRLIDTANGFIIVSESPEEILTKIL